MLRPSTVGALLLSVVVLDRRWRLPSPDLTSDLPPLAVGTLPTG